MICRICGKPVAGGRCIYCNKAAVGYIDVVQQSGKTAVAEESQTAVPPETETQVNVNAAPQKNSLALAGLILACFGYTFIIGFILSIVGLVKSKSLNGAGKGQAIAGIVISAFFIATVVYMVLCVLVFKVSPLWPWQ